MKILNYHEKCKESHYTNDLIDMLIMIKLMRMLLIMRMRLLKMLRNDKGSSHGCNEGYL